MKFPQSFLSFQFLNYKFSFVLKICITFKYIKRAIHIVSHNSDTHSFCESDAEYGNSLRHRVNAVFSTFVFPVQVL